MQTQRRWHLYIRLAALAVFQLSLVQVLSRLIPQLLDGQFIDYQVYQVASYRFLLGDAVYEQSSVGLPFLYPPPAVLFLSVFVLLAGTDSIWLFTAGSLGALLYSVWLLLQIAQTKLSCSYPLYRQLILADRWSSWLFASAFALQTFPVKLTLANGQINHFVLLLICLSLYSTAKKRNLVAHLSLAAAVLLKVYPVVLLIPLVLQKKWRALLEISGMVFAPLLVFAPYTLSFLQQVVLPKLHLQSDRLPTAADQSLTAVLQRLQLHPTVTTLVVGAVFCYCIWLLWKQRSQSVLCLQLLSLPLIIVIASPVWSHQLVLLYPWLVLLSPAGLGLLWILLAVPLPVSEVRSALLYLKASLAPMSMLLLYKRALLRK